MQCLKGLLQCWVFMVGTILYSDCPIFCYAVPLYVTIGSAVTGTLGSGSTNNYQFDFPSNGITIILNVGTGTINCYASDRYIFPTSTNYDWSISVSGYANVFIDPDLIGRTAGSYMYVALQGALSSNTYTLNTTTGDRRG